MESIITQEILQTKNKVKIKENNFNVCDLNWILKKTNTEKNKVYDRSISLIDLYCGCGGMTLGVKEALRNKNFSLDIKLAVDSNLPAIEVYRNNFAVGNDIATDKDINDIVSTNIGQPLNATEKALKKKIKELDILVAGPPCQGHSNLNNHTRRNDPRNDLYLNAVRMIEILRPRIAIIENVSTVIHDKENIVGRAQEAMKSLGYNIYSQIINASKYGLAQSRKRHFHIAILNSPIDLDLESFKTQRLVPISDYIGDILNENIKKKGIFYSPSVTKKINKERIDFLFDNKLFDLPDDQRPDCHKNKSHSYKSCYGRLNWDKPAQTITSGFGSMGQGRYIHPLQRRVITPHEAARIQGFPDFFSFESVELRGDLHTMIANAVPPRILAMLISHVIEKQIL